jgi:hypothetical protein
MNKKTPRVVSERFGIILIGIPEASGSPFNSNTMQLTKSTAITQPYLDCARGSKTPLLKPVFSRSEHEFTKLLVSLATQLSRHGRGIDV